MAPTPLAELHASQSFTTFCSAFVGSKPLIFEWLKNDVVLREGSVNYNIQSFDDSNSVLKIPSVAKSDAGNYTCRVSNAYGSDTISTKLSVKSKPFL